VLEEGGVPGRAGNGSAADPALMALNGLAPLVTSVLAALIPQLAKRATNVVGRNSNEAD
jgi:hypothetical protein